METYNCAPDIKHRAHIKNNQIAFGFDIFFGEELSLTMPEGSPRFWVGSYVDEGFLCAMSSVCYKFRHEELLMVNDRTITFDLQKAHVAKNEVHIEVLKGKNSY